MSKLPRPTQFSQHDISRGTQDVKATFIFNRGPAKVRISIRSDSYDFQCYARAELFSTSDTKWNVVGHIPYGQMLTPPKLYYLNSGGMAKHLFMADFDKLLDIVDDLLGVTLQAVTAPAVALIFADVPAGGSFEEGLVGPLFFDTSLKALLRFADYLVPRLKNEGMLTQELAFCTGVGCEEDADAFIDGASVEELLKAIAGCDEDRLQSLCDDYIRLRKEGGAQSFYRIEPAVMPQA